MMLCCFLENRYLNAMKRAVLCVAVLDVVQRVVDEELELGHDAKLALDLLTEAEADVLGVGTHGPDDGVLVGGHIDAQVGARDRQVGRDGGFGHGNHTTIDAFAVLQEDIGQLPLQQGRYFLLSRGAHILNSF